MPALRSFCPSPLTNHDAGTALATADVVAWIKGFFTRILAGNEYDEIGNFIATNGGVLTDDLERRIGRRLMR